jgi:hypothetical protein
VHPRATAVASLEAIAKAHPDTRAVCINHLAQQLRRFSENHPGLNGFLINSLVELKAEETATLIEDAFSANRVDAFIVGNWDAVQAELGLKAPLPPKDFSTIPPLHPLNLLEGLERLKKQQAQWEEWDRQEEEKITARSKSRSVKKKKRRK